MDLFDCVVTIYKQTKTKQDEKHIWKKKKTTERISLAKDLRRLRLFIGYRAMKSLTANQMKFN